MIVETKSVMHLELGVLQGIVVINSDLVFTTTKILIGHRHLYGIISYKEKTIVCGN